MVKIEATNSQLISRNWRQNICCIYFDDIKHFLNSYKAALNLLQQYLLEPGVVCQNEFDFQYSFIIHLECQSFLEQKNRDQDALKNKHHVEQLWVFHKGNC